jgi:hypothetical protein
VPKPIEVAARSKYEYKLVDAGLERAVERATRVRATLDSTRAAQQPASAVPLPGAPQGPPVQSQGAQPSAPAPKQ